MIVINEEIEDLEIICRKLFRSEYLIATFSDGYAAGWSFAVKESFKPALDIRLTDRSIKKKKYKIWTQGQNFDFREGDVLHNSVIAENDWDYFITTKKPVSLQVVSASSTGFVGDSTIYVNDNPVSITTCKSEKIIKSEVKSFNVVKQKYDHGIVVFNVLMPDDFYHKMTKKYELKLKQSEFIALLQTGTYYDVNKKDFVSLNFEE